jgi:hypothetical protein
MLDDVLASRIDNPALDLNSTTVAGDTGMERSVPSGKIIDLVIKAIEFNGMDQ